MEDSVILEAKDGMSTVLAKCVTQGGSPGGYIIETYEELIRWTKLC